MAIYAVDFDGTLAVTRFPEIVEPKRKIVAAVKMLKANGHKVILWTSRAGRDLEAAVEWCHGQGLEFDAVNEPCRSKWKGGGMTQERFMRIFT